MIAEGLVVGWIAKLATDAAYDTGKDYVRKCFGEVFSPLNRKVLSKALDLAVQALLNQLVDELLDVDMGTEEVRELEGFVAAFLEQEPVQQAIGSLFLEPGFHLDPATLATAWNTTEDAPTLPDDFSWKRVGKRFTRKVEAIREDSEELRETFAQLRSAKDSEDQRKLRDLPPEFDLDKYADALVERFASLSLDSLDTDGAAYNAVRLWNVFVPQSIRECQNYRPQLLELPKEEQQRLIAEGKLDAQQIEYLRQIHILEQEIERKSSEWDESSEFNELRSEEREIEQEFSGREIEQESCEWDELQSGNEKRRRLESKLRGLESKRRGLESKRRGLESKRRELESKRTELLQTYFEQTPSPVLDICADPQLSRLVILGDPGSGKSSLLRYLALEWARDTDVNRRYTAPLSLLIELRDYNQWDCPNGKGFAAYLHHARTWHRLNQQTLDVLLKTKGRVVLLLDGLDEIFDPKEREQAINDIHRFSNDYPDTRIIMTSRVVGYKPQRLRGAGFLDFMLQDLDEEQIAEFLIRWHETTFTETNEAERKRERFVKAIKESKPIRLLTGNPLLLTLMAIINRNQELPRDRVRLYEKASELLLQQWDTERYLQDFLGLSGEIDLRAKSAILRRVALAMQTTEGQEEGRAANIIQGESLTGLIEAYLLEVLHFNQARAATNALVEQLRQRNFILCFLGANSYAFVHRTFLEYFCAAEFVYQFEKKKNLSLKGLLKLYDVHCQDDDWQEILRLICGQIDERFSFVIIKRLSRKVDMEIWNGKLVFPELVLAVWCLSEIKLVNNFEELGEELLSKALDCFRGGTANNTDELISAAKAVGPRWPGRSKYSHYFHQYPTDNQNTYQAGSPWLRFLQAVFQEN